MNKSPDFVRYLSHYQGVSQMKSDRLLGRCYDSQGSNGLRNEIQIRHQY
ncbi:MAG: hypothetical protein LBT01_03395 [Spirochaetaceae bacterium]|jgi:hypothetical protein|nr:hypothetical protein [Spirochaetaceae bacterium]